VLEGHVRNVDAARKKRDWGMARLALDKCLQSIESEGAEVPMEWRCWRVELELCKRNLDGASAAAKWVFFLSFRESSLCSVLS